MGTTSARKLAHHSLTMRSPAWPLETARLTLRPFVPDDFAAFAAIAGDPEIARWLYNEPRSGDEAQAHFDRKRTAPSLGAEGAWMSCAIVERETAELVGDLAFHWISEEHRTGEIGFIVASGQQGKGYATEASGALLDWAFAAGFHRVIGRVEARNTASGRVLEKLGMRQEALLVENEWVKGEWQSELVFAVLEREWLSKADDGQIARMRFTSPPP
jgi:RimJ/RimL family protein N-acetyltransferase